VAFTAAARRSPAGSGRRGGVLAHGSAGHDRRARLAER
jgi:hypothetical protein